MAVSQLACSDEMLGGSSGLVKERGQRQVFCGLAGIVWLHRKIQDAFFLVVGSRTCAHLLQSAAGVMIFAEPRFATAILTDHDISGIADSNDELDRMVAEVVERRPDIKTVFLVGSCPSEIIKLDLGKAAQRLTEHYAGKLRVLDYSASGLETTFTQGEDTCIEALIPHLPEAPEAEKSLLVLGTLPDVVEDQFLRIFNALGLNKVAFLPPRSVETLPAIGRSTAIIAAQPFLTQSVMTAKHRGAKVLSAPFPFGIEGTLEWLRSICRHWNISEERLQEVVAPAIERARKGLAHYRALLSGKRISFLPDSQLEIPIARFLQRECGMELVEVATPFIDAQLMDAELRLLPEQLRLVEGQDIDAQIARLREDRPDLTVCGLGVANPLEAEGLHTKWSIELVFTPVHGFDQAADLAELFARPLTRANLLKV